MNNVVSQSVPHLHVHVVPRTKGDGLRGFFWPRTKYASDDEAQEYAARLAAALPPPPDLTPVASGSAGPGPLDRSNDRRWAVGGGWQDRHRAQPHGDLLAPR